MPNVISNSEEKGDYIIHESTNSGSTKYLRPINKSIFIDDTDRFRHAYNKLQIDLNSIKISKNQIKLSIESLKNIDSVLYTIQQSLGCGMDLLINSNSARKHIGNRLEELIKVVFSAIGVKNDKVILKIPYKVGEGKTKNYKCENDLILSPYDNVKSSSSSIDKREIVLSVKTSSKDRMGKIFIDKMLLKKFVGHDVKVIGIFLNDVQRKENNNFSYTLVSGLFMVYTKFLTELDGVYYLDPPPHESYEPYSKHIHKFSKLIVEDLWELLSS